MYIGQNYIEKDLVEICFNDAFGQDSSKRRKDGSIVQCRWYSKELYDFLKNNNIDKLDDLSDTILMMLTVRR